MGGWADEQVDGHIDRQGDRWTYGNRQTGRMDRQMLSGELLYEVQIQREQTDREIGRKYRETYIETGRQFNSYVCFRTGMLFWQEMRSHLNWSIQFSICVHLSKKRWQVVKQMGCFDDRQNPLSPPLFHLSFFLSFTAISEQMRMFRKECDRGKSQEVH